MPDISRLFEDRISRWKDVLLDSSLAAVTRHVGLIVYTDLEKITRTMYRQVYYIWDSRRKTWKKDRRPEIDGSEIQVSECHTMA
jgi:hypothetical protein